MGVTVFSSGKWKREYHHYFNRVHMKMYRKAVKILISIVIGALLLAGLYALFGDVILPTLQERIEDMFNFAG
jgi:hypothetical protein